MMSASNLKAQLEEAIALAQAGQRAEARAMLEAVVAADPGQALAWMWLATVSTERERRIECLERALALNPDNTTALEAYTQLTGQIYEPPTGAAAPVTEGPQSMLGGLLVVLAIAIVGIAVVALVIFVRDNRSQDDDQKKDSGGKVIIPTRVPPTLAPTVTPRFSPTPSRPPLPTRTPGPSPTWLWENPNATWTPSPSYTPFPTSTPLPSYTPVPSITPTPSSTPSVTPLPPTRTPNARTMTAEVERIAATATAKVQQEAATMTAEAAHNSDVSSTPTPFATAELADATPTPEE